MIEQPISVLDNIQYKTIKPKRCLILRVGGLGDILILSAIAKALHEKGFLVDFFMGSPTGEIHEFFQGLPFIANAKKIQRVSGVDCVEDEDKHLVSVELLKRQYDEVFDYKLSVEENRVGFNKTDDWRASINSNYQNWVDLSLAWANIDPTKIADKDKRPIIHFGTTNGEQSKFHQWVLKYLPLQVGTTKIIGIQLQASSLIRSQYYSDDLPNIIHQKYPEYIVVLFSGGKWYALSRFGKEEMKFEEGLNPLMCSAALIDTMDVFITADSGSSHLAEAVGTPTIGIYTTVPAWTRTKYYDKSHDIQTDVVCHPCFTLDLFCPIRKREAFDSLSQREKDIIKQLESGVNIYQVAKDFSTMPKAIQMEYESAKKRVEALSAQEAACVKSITPDMIMNKLSEVLNEK